jgi:uncharacterized protein (DUF4415 family)
MGTNKIPEIYGVPDDENPEWTEQDFARAKPLSEALPGLAAAITRGRGKQKAPTKERISLRLESTALARFRTLGPGWQTKISEAVSKAAEQLPKAPSS